MFSKAMITAHSSEQSVMERLERYSEVNETTGCIEWTKGKDQYGYGRISVGQRRLGAHRVAYAMQVGPVPKGKVVMHSCDNPKCINPKHLSIGTPKENVHDCIAKGRFPLAPRASNRAAGCITKRRVIGAVQGDTSMFFKDIYEAERMGFRNEGVSQSCTKGRLYKGFQWSYLT